MLINPLNKNLKKREQVSIDNDEKQEGARAENNLMKDVKVKNQFLEEKKKKQKKVKKVTQNVLSVTRKNHLKYLQNVEKITWEKLKTSFKNIKFRNEKKPKRAETTIIERTESTTTIKHPAERKKLI